MSTKDRNELQKLNAVSNSINRVINFGLQNLQQATVDDLRMLQEKMKKRQLELINK